LAPASIPVIGSPINTPTRVPVVNGYTRHFVIGPKNHHWPHVASNATNIAEINISFSSS